MAGVTRAPYYTAAEVGVIANVGPITVKRWIRAGDLPAVGGGRGRGHGWRVRHEDLERFLQKHWSPYITLNVPEPDDERKPTGGVDDHRTASLERRRL